jgi:hypothetical protein
MAKKKRKDPKVIAERGPQRAEMQRMVRERIAYHEAKTKEQEGARERSD